MQKQNIIFKSGITLVLSLLFFVNVSVAQKATLKNSYWKATLQLNDSTSLPFNFYVRTTNNKITLEIINADEKIIVDDISFANDSIFIKMPVFNSEFKCRKQSDSQITGAWINYARKTKNIIPFKAISMYPDGIYGKESDSIFFAKSAYEVTFSDNTNDSYKAVGLFKEQNFYYVEGTFLTETGDYRYLSGNRDGNKFSLSCFDGSHAFLFTGEVKGDSIVNGHFYSGAHHHEPWVAVRNDNFQLRNPDSLTYLKPGFTSIDFSFKNLEGKSVSIKDEKFKNKVVIIQIMGSWCPNCMDETKFLAPFYDKYNSKGLEVVALAFERTDDFNKAVNNIQRSKKRFSANYEFLITMKTGKDQASEALPMLNAVMAFPTTIYIDKKGVVRKIYTGFNGPATGDAHTKFVEDTTRFVEMLLAE